MIWRSPPNLIHRCRCLDDQQTSSNSMNEQSLSSVTADLINACHSHWSRVDFFVSKILLCSHPSSRLFKSRKEKIDAFRSSFYGDVNRSFILFKFNPKLLFFPSSEFLLRKCFENKNKIAPKPREIDTLIRSFNKMLNVIAYKNLSFFCMYSMTIGTATPITRGTGGWNSESMIIPRRKNTAPYTAV